jgi:hypothetical protein
VEGPRIYCIPATDAPVVAVFRRGPSRWAHVGRWDLAAGRYEGGAWLAGRIFPRRSDLSPDGKWLCYFAHKASKAPPRDESEGSASLGQRLIARAPRGRRGAWEHGDAYVAISKLPWLTALHAFGTCGTWTRGYHFIAGDRSTPDGLALPIAFGLRPTAAIQFESERRRGWIESPDSPPRDPRDAWDQHRQARMEKAQPVGTAVLHVESVGHAGGEFAEQAIDGLRVRYWMERLGEMVVLDDLQWADWDRDGRLLAATRSGLLQVRDVADPASAAFEVDLSRLEPSPEPAPASAADWA